VFESDGATLVIDEISLEMLTGAKVDYTMELIKRSFVIAENPNAEAGCGCGISFSLK
jgi:iron-sulfur cluster assembly accessory protein